MTHRTTAHPRLGLLLALTILMPVLAACAGATPSAAPATAAPAPATAAPATAAPATAAPATEAPAAGGTFIGAWVGPCCNGNDWITPLDPGGDAHWFNKIYGRLTTFEVLDPIKQAAEFDSNSGVYGKLTGDLAESWEISADQLTWTFHLRSGVTWHDGEPFTANDVKFTFELCLNPKNTMAPCHYVTRRRRRGRRQGVPGRHGDRDHRRQGRRRHHDLPHVHRAELALPDSISELFILPAAPAEGHPAGRASRRATTGRPRRSAPAPSSGTSTRPVSPPSSWRSTTTGAASRSSTASSVASSRIRPQPSSRSTPARSTSPTSPRTKSRASARTRTPSCSRATRASTTRSSSTRPSIRSSRTRKSARR